MSIEIKVPVLPESVVEATIAAWHKKSGETVLKDEKLVDIETDKVVLEVVAPDTGTIKEILKKQGALVRAEEVIGYFEKGAVPEAKEISFDRAPAPQKEPSTSKMEVSSGEALVASPAIRRMMAENNITSQDIQGTGKGSQITKQDVEDYLKNNGTSLEKESGKVKEVALNLPIKETAWGSREEKRVPMTRLRAKIAERLLSAQHNAALLTTFNEINMKPLMDLRARYKDEFFKEYGVKLGLMSFFTKATIEALKHFPVVNASVDGSDIVYHGYFDIGIAVSSDRGLVVPVLRDVDHMSIAEIEKKILELSQKAREGKLSIEEITGGTFTITNGGVFGSLLATPILNPPQTGILGMHKIEDRPIAEKGEVVIRPMMYVALTYDHRLIDGRDSIQFLLAIKEKIEDPSRLLLEI